MKRTLLSAIFLLWGFTVLVASPTESHGEDDCTFLGLREGMSYEEAKKVVKIIEVSEERNGVKVVIGTLRKKNPAVEILALHVCKVDGLGLIIANAKKRSGTIDSAFEYWKSYYDKLEEKYRDPSTLTPDTYEELQKITLLSIIREESRLNAVWNWVESTIPTCLEYIAVEIYVNDNGDFWPKVIYQFKNYQTIEKRFNEVKLEGF